MNVARLVGALMAAGLAATSVALVVRRKAPPPKVTGRTQRRAPAPAPQQVPELKFAVPPSDGPRRQFVAGHRPMESGLGWWDSGSLDRVGEGPAYVCSWTWRLWITDRPSRAMQFRKWGALRPMTAAVGASSWAAASDWADAMQGEAGLVVDAASYAQKYQVDPWPAQWSAGFDCYNAPGINAAKNLACMLPGKNRAGRPITVTVHESLALPGWFVARWRWGPLAAARSADECLAEAKSHLAQINTFGLSSSN